MIPNGRSITVTDDNKFEYVRLVANHRMSAGIKAQIESFLDGFYELVPPELITIFSPTELELLICGLPDIDVSDLMKNTDYAGYRGVTDDVIRWFWEVLHSFNQADKALFVQFVTGTSKVSFYTYHLFLFGQFIDSNVLQWRLILCCVGSSWRFRKFAGNARPSEIFYSQSIC